MTLASLVKDAAHLQGWTALASDPLLLHSRAGPALAMPFYLCSILTVPSSQSILPTRCL